MRHSTISSRQTLAASLLDASSTLYEIARALDGAMPTEMALRVVRHGDLVSVTGYGRIDGQVTVASASVGSFRKAHATVWLDERGSHSAALDEGRTDGRNAYEDPSQAGPQGNATQPETTPCEPPRSFYALASPGPPPGACQLPCAPARLGPSCPRRS